MNGIELGNIFASTALMRQKNGRIEQAEAKGERTEQTGKEKTGKVDKAAQAVAGQSRKAGINSLENAAQNVESAGKGTDTQLANKGVSQTNQAAQNGVGLTGQNTQAGFSQTGISTNRIGQTNSLSPVNRQRLAQQRKAKTAAKKKNLNYNRREVSSQVLRANKIGSAARALATARTKVSSLRRCVGTGQYDENELRIAISHAESIVKTARKKVANLKEEQIKEKRVAREKQTNTINRRVKKQRVRSQRQKVKRELNAQRRQAENQTKAKEMRCKQLKRRHRGEELSDVVEADVKYIKDMDRYRRYGAVGGSRNTAGTANTTGTAALEIGDSAMRLNDLQRTEQALKYEEQQMNQEAASFSGSAEIGSVDILVGDGAAASGTGDAGAAVADMAAVGGSVDVSL